MAETSFFSRFTAPTGDPLATEHEAIVRYVDEALASLGKDSCWQDLDLGKISGGRTLLDAKSEGARRILVASVQQAIHWETEIQRVLRQREGMKTIVGDHQLPGWLEAYGPLKQTVQVVQTFLRRSLPLVKDDVLLLLRWHALCSKDYRSLFPMGFVTRAIERFAAANGVDDDVRPALANLARWLQGSYETDAKRFGTIVANLLSGETGTEEPPVAARLPPPKQAPAGNPRVLVMLKRKLGIAVVAENVVSTERGRDRFPFSSDSPFDVEHAKLDAAIEEVSASDRFRNAEFREMPTGRIVAESQPAGRMLLAAMERRVHATFSPHPANEFMQRPSWAASMAVAVIDRSPAALTREELFDVLLFVAVLDSFEYKSWAIMLGEYLKQVELEASRVPLSEGERFVLHLWRASLISSPHLGASPPEVARLTGLIGDAAAFYLVPGEAWTDAVNALVSTSPKKVEWKALLVHSLLATGSRPSAKWLKTAGQLVEGVGVTVARVAIADWLGRMPKGATFKLPGARDVLNEQNMTCLRGLLWLVPLLPDPGGLARLVSAVAVSAYRKIPGIGPRAVKVGNAAVYALSELGSTDAVGQLAMLKVRVKFGSAQKEIEKAFGASAAALGLPRDQVEELGVPSYGLEETGRLEETLGEHRVELFVTGSDAELRWFDGTGKPVKSVPAAVKKDHAEKLKELQQSLKDIEAMLPAQRDRLDGLFLARASWPAASWRERYLDHPLVGTIARRLIWSVDGAPALFADGAATDIAGRPVAVADTATITLWHPVGRTIEEITSWRRRLEALGITQPFKQAHREIYILTDAERRTATYSNRFAAHILRQHQFNALCGARGWKNKLRLMVDASYGPPTRDLPHWGLRAEFWIEGVGTTYGTDTNETGTYLRVATDQVRFYRLATATPGAPPAELLPLEAVPPLVFSEIMRDVDLFVGVGSVGNDPTWQDGGPEGRFRAYWQSYSFGELSASAATRREVLERLVPRLKIANRCTFADRFLVVRGDKRTYKIHLGSGNILMEPNDQYLCIVPDQCARSAEDSLYLPFEGDSVLSIIISKALLLAADSKIKDQTILKQLEKG